MCSACRPERQTSVVTTVVTVLFGLFVPEVVISCQNADGLQRLAEAHVVTQDPVQLVLVQEGQPVHSILQDDTETQ